jgi:hypothetical protein
LLNDKFGGRPSENAKFAKECKDTPLEPHAILELVWGNIGYFGDHYYEQLARPISLRVEEYYDSLAVSPEQLDASAAQ